MKQPPISFLLRAIIALALGCVQAAPAPRVIAHRGNSLFAPENTLAAFVLAEGKADAVEFDVRISRDGHLVLMHDSTVDRTTDGTGAVSALDLADLKQLDAGSWFLPAFAGERIPTLEEALITILPRTIPLIERKAGPASAYVSELRRLGAVTNVILQAFDWSFLAEVHALEPEIALAALGSGSLTPAMLSSIRETGARTVAWAKGDITAEEVARAHAAGLAVYVWTVDGPEIQNYLASGVDGIISNDPGLARAFGSDPLLPLPYLAEELMVYWDLDDGLTDPWAVDVVDRHGSNTARLIRTDTLSHWANSSLVHPGGCVQVDGTDAYVVIPQTPSLEIETNAVTLAAWVWLSQLPSQSPESFAGIFDSAQDSYVLYLDRGNRELRFKITDSNGHASRPGIQQSFLQTNQWLHVAGTFNGQAGPASGQATVYLNGRAMDVHTGNDGGGVVGLTASVRPGQRAAIGRNGTQAQYPFLGLVDEVVVWRRALSPREIETLHQAGRAGRALRDLLEDPSPLINITSIQLVPPDAMLRIDFLNEGPWKRFELHRVFPQAAPVVLELEPIFLGDGTYRFELFPPAEPVGFFRIQGNAFPR